MYMYVRDAGGGLNYFGPAASNKFAAAGSNLFFRAGHPATPLRE